MSDVANRVVLISRDPSTINSVGALVSGQNWSVESLDDWPSWLHNDGNMDRPPNSSQSLTWVECVIIDVPLQAKDGAKPVSAVCRDRCGLPVVVVSPDPKIEGVVAAMQSGAMTVIPRPFNDAELLSAVSAAMQLTSIRLPQLTRVAEARKHLALLNTSELAVLQKIMDGMANKEIAHDLELGLRTVELRRSRIMKKMKSGSVAELVRVVCEANGVVVDPSCRFA